MRRVANMTLTFEKMEPVQEKGKKIKKSTNAFEPSAETASTLQGMDVSGSVLSRDGSCTCMEKLLRKITLLVDSSKNKRTWFSRMFPDMSWLMQFRHFLTSIFRETSQETKINFYRIQITLLAFIIVNALMDLKFEHVMSLFRKLAKCCKEENEQRNSILVKKFPVHTLTRRERPDEVWL